MKLSGDKKPRRNRIARGVRAPYTFENLKSDVLYLHDAKGANLSLRKIAKKYGVSHGVIQRVIAGREPVIPHIRSAFGLPPHYIEVTPLPCGHAPLRDRCPICKTPTKYAPHPVVRLAKLRRLMQSPYNNS